MALRMQLRPIEDLMSHQVCFSKRRLLLLKSASSPITPLSGSFHQLPPFFPSCVLSYMAPPATSDLAGRTSARAHVDKQGGGGWCWHVISS